MTIGSNVWLIGSHHNHEKKDVHDGAIVFPEGKMDGGIVKQMGWVALTEEMLNWPLLGLDRSIEITDSMSDGYPWLSMYRACLRAMFELKDVTFVVSIGADTEEKKLKRFKRDWVWLHQGDTGRYLFSFSHHTKKDNAPFSSMIDWVQEDNEPKEPAKFREFLQGWCTPLRWQQLFFERTEGVLTGQIRGLNEKIDGLNRTKDALGSNLQFLLATRVARERAQGLR